MSRQSCCRCRQPGAARSSDGFATPRCGWSSAGTRCTSSRAITATARSRITDRRRPLSLRENSAATRSRSAGGRDPRAVVLHGRGRARSPRIAPDVVHHHSRPAGLWLTGRGAAAAPQVISLHSMDYGWGFGYRGWDRPLYRRGLAAAARVLCVSDFIRAHAVERYPAIAAKTTRRIYNGVDGRTLHTGRGATSAAAQTILYVGRVEERKGVHVLLDAFERVIAARAPHARLRIVGPAFVLGSPAVAVLRRAQGAVRSEPAHRAARSDLRRCRARAGLSRRHRERGAVDLSGSAGPDVDRSPGVRRAGRGLGCRRTARNGVGPAQAASCSRTATPSSSRKRCVGLLMDRTAAPRRWAPPRASGRCRCSRGT